MLERSQKQVYVVIWELDINICRGLGQEVCILVHSDQSLSLNSSDSFVFITHNLWSGAGYLAKLNWISLQNYASEQKDTGEILQNGHVPDVVIVRVHTIMTKQGEQKEVET